MHLTNVWGWPVTWTCHICSKERDDEFISVFVHDCSIDYELPMSTFISNVRYCNDNEDCKRKAEDPAYPHHGQALKYKDE